MLRTWRFISIYLTALTLSLTFSHLLEMPGKMQCGAVVALSTLSVLLRKRGLIFQLTLLATVCVAAGLAVWFVIVSPANGEMARWSAVPLPADCKGLRHKWMLPGQV